MGYLDYMINAVSIDRRNERNAKVLDVLESLRDECGSVANAAVQCIKESGRFKAAQEKLESQNNSTPNGVGDNCECSSALTRD